MGKKKKKRPTSLEGLSGGSLRQATGTPPLSDRTTDLCALQCSEPYYSPPHHHF